ncbi:hypothetical protein GF323_05065 [Candidatus Woesearchaeota archaeon]|nr:hypothetical protein [Candidatus Woesearchaeota archaeon]
MQVLEARASEDFQDGLAVVLNGSATLMLKDAGKKGMQVPMTQDELLGLADCVKKNRAYGFGTAHSQAYMFPYEDGYSLHMSTQQGNVHKAGVDIPITTVESMQRYAIHHLG